MDQAAIDNTLRTLAGWQQLNDRIVMSFSFDDFRSAMKFVGRVADAAVAVTDEVALEVRSNLVTLAVYTPDAGPRRSLKMHQMSGSVDSTLRLLDLADEGRFPLMSHVW